MAKLADAPDLGSGAARHVGSTPSTRTFFQDYFSDNNLSKTPNPKLETINPKPISK